MSLRDNNFQQLQLDPNTTSASSAIVSSSIAPSSSGQSDNKKSRSQSQIIFIVLILLLVFIIVVGIVFVVWKANSHSSSGPLSVSMGNSFSAVSSPEIAMTSGDDIVNGSNAISDFDLYFLKHANTDKNLVYSPLSIKYALQMAADASLGDTYEQIISVLKDYVPHRYENNAHITVTNAIFVRDTFANDIKSEYIDVLADKYDAQVLYDSFTSPQNINLWIKNKTFGLIDEFFTDISDKDFLLANTVAIDMEWVNKIQCDVYPNLSGTGEKSTNCQNLYVRYPHLAFPDPMGYHIYPLEAKGYTELEFVTKQEANNYGDILSEETMSAQAVEFAAIANKYDLVKTLGVDNIKNTVRQKYDDWKDSEDSKNCSDIKTDIETYLDEYIESIDSNYGQFDSSTDFYFYDDKNIKIFAKDLQEYDGHTLQYIGVMPKKTSLTQFIRSLDATDINSYRHWLKPVVASSFEEGVITYLHGVVPMFHYDYSLDLITRLKELGITDVFSPEKADISRMTNVPFAAFDDAQHRVDIEFSNDGIKAAATTDLGGYGAGGCWFDYFYRVPVKEIDLTFDKPFIYLVLDKDTSEVWFVGAVYQPLEYVSPNPENKPGFI